MLNLFDCPSASASDAVIPSADVVDVVRKAKVVSSEYPLHVIVGDSLATVLTRRHHKATDDDLKIDAVLISKAVLDKFGDRLGRVKVLFRDEDSSFGKAVTVTTNDIKTYANGSMEPQRFLASLAIKKVDSEPDSSRVKNELDDSSLAVSPGPYQEQRLLLLDRINTLRKRGTGVAPFEKIFLELNSTAASGDKEAVGAAVNDLSRRLGEQEDLIKQAARVGSGHGIRGIQGTTAEVSNRNQQFGEGYGAAAGQGGSGGGAGDFKPVLGKIHRKLMQMSQEHIDIEPYKRELKDIDSRMQGNESSRRQGLTDLENMAKRIKADDLPSGGGSTQHLPPDPPGSGSVPTGQGPFGFGPGKGNMPPFNEGPY